MSGVAGPDRADVLGLIPLAATVITAGTAAEPVGFTGSAWGEPRNPGWLTIPVSSDSATLPTLLDHRRIGVNLLGEKGRHLVGHFARRVEQRSQRFDGVPWSMRHEVPLVDDAVAWYVCTLESTAEFGAYQLLICRVQHSSRGAEDAPLVYVNGHGLSAVTPGKREVP